MDRHSFIQMSKLSDVRGRISYITSPVRQENLYATYRTCDSGFWSDLARENQEDFRRSGTAGKCIEARELIIALPEEFVDLQPQDVLRDFTEHLRELYGVECVSALHHNKAKPNYHIHLIFAERQLLKEPVVKTASRSMFYDEQGKHVRTKKEILDDHGKVRSGCRIVKKGDVYERLLFDKKSARFKSKGFLKQIKESYTDLINSRLSSEHSKLEVYRKDSIYLPMKKIGKNNPKEDIIRRNNDVARRWNLHATYAETIMGTDYINMVKVQELVCPIKDNITGKKQVTTYYETVKLAIKLLEILIKEWYRILPENRPQPKDEEFKKLLQYCRQQARNRKHKENER